MSQTVPGATAVVTPPVVVATATTTPAPTSSNGKWMIYLALVLAIAALVLGMLALLRSGTTTVTGATAATGCSSGGTGCCESGGTECVASTDTNGVVDAGSSYSVDSVGLQSRTLYLGPNVSTSTVALPSTSDPNHRGARWTVINNSGQAVNFSVASGDSLAADSILPQGQSALAASSGSTWFVGASSTGSSSGNKKQGSLRAETTKTQQTINKNQNSLVKWSSAQGASIESLTVPSSGTWLASYQVNWASSAPSGQRMASVVVNDNTSGAMSQALHFESAPAISSATVPLSIGTAGQSVKLYVRSSQPDAVGPGSFLTLAPLSS